MFQPLYVAATGLSSFQDEMLNITNNLSNAKTVGFKRGRTEMESLFYVEKSFQDVMQEAMAEAPKVNPEFGTGVRVAATPRDFVQGAIETSNNPLDVAIQGEGFLQFKMPDGSIAYGRAGNLHIDDQGNLADPNGHLLEPPIVLPQGTSSVTIRVDGTVLANQSEIGQITLVKFSNPAGLKSLGQNLYVSNPSSGDPIVGYAAADGFGSVNQFALESSNVDVISEMMRMVMIQRIFETITKAVGSYEGMLTALEKMKA
ncbi:MAG: flagellar basal-body rod protein FlgG [Candidatus Saganbacteria bacterium]|uniref:Flagellar basal-body rod protein FlgG n=1 Tax=Candidatus Saganbacteria bacterium TaxID=2575572 RepID=A0A833L085_UNCSA|nr:MAG: flagellar basal-body rod protein FlgG [Candidatus Saganbacteria bacterium]